MNRLLVDGIIRNALLEDIGHGDITTELVPESGREVRATFLAKASGVLAGIDVAVRCFELLDPDCRATLQLRDGAELESGLTIGAIHGPGTAVLAAERVALNFLQRMSGIATQAARLAHKARPFGIRVVETRKTTPGLRTLEKYAVRTGGKHNHRMDLDHAVMLKDNHFALWGGDPGQLVRNVKEMASHTMKIVAEADSLEMVEPLLKYGADVILLDNFTPDEVRAAVKLIGGRATIELSGGINEGNIEGYLIPGVDVISIGALTHSYRALDISLELET